MKTIDIRKAFLAYFEQQGHQVVASSSLVPENDPTLLFTNAGMNQFKDVFLGNDKRSYRRATTAQRVVRAGGKHNDLENVGYTARHHTYFEMLGNFSFGDYFKRDAIRFAWEFLTGVLNLPKERLWVTVFREDDEAADIWVNEIGVDPNRLSRLDEKDNFWQMGDTGPCGPCTEIFYDHGPEVPGGPPGSENDDLDRYIEIWNLVFMQYNRFADGRLEPLPKPSVDTGMGLERLAAILQGVHSNYEIDLFQNLIHAVAAELSIKDMENQSLRVIADHIRSTAFLIVDGVMPSNEGRGYVLRRIIRRALRHGHKLGAVEPFFYRLVRPLITEMGEVNPDLIEKQKHVEKILRLEEEQFAKTLDNGMKILQQALSELEGKTLPGEVAFKLYDTYGFPLDLTADVAREQGVDVDQAGFDQAMDRQRETARKANQFEMDYNHALHLDGETAFHGYDALVESADVKSLLVGHQEVSQIAQGDEAVVVLAHTPFYAESGGQVGDQGYIRSESAVFKVTDCKKQGKVHLHYGKVVQGVFKQGDKITAEVDANRRQQIALHHSATHLLHAALRSTLGSHVQQKGSIVLPDRLRFDFSHLEAMSAEEIQQVENLVNAQIRANTAVTTESMDIEQAKAKGAMALFGEKYDEQVRVLSMGTEQFSVELCGGTHARRTGDIGFLTILSESGIASGVRRVEAVVGESALEYVRQQQQCLHALGDIFKSSPDALVDKSTQMFSKMKLLEKEVEQLKAKLASGAGNDLAAAAKAFGDIQVLAAEIPGADVKALRATMDQLKNKLGRAIILLGSAEDEKVSLIAGVTKDLTGTYKAGEIVNVAAQHVDGKGGGKPDLAQAGGRRAEGLKDAIASLWQWAEVHIK